MENKKMEKTKINTDNENNLVEKVRYTSLNKTAKNIHRLRHL